MGKKKRPAAEFSAALLKRELLLWKKRAAGRRYFHVARDVGVSWGTLGSWRSGRSAPGVNDYARLCAAVDLPFGAFMGRPR